MITNKNGIRSRFKRSLLQIWLAVTTGIRQRCRETRYGVTHPYTLILNRKPNTHAVDEITICNKFSCTTINNNLHLGKN